METLKIPLVQIGGSRGIRIPKKILERCHMDGNVVVVVDRGEIILKAEQKPREGWTVAAREIHRRGEDKVLVDDTLDLHNDEWEW